MLLIALLVVGASASTRDVISANFGWRFFLGNPGDSTACNASTFPVPLNAQQCDGLQGQQGVNSVAACLASACTNDDQVWQYCTQKDCTPTSNITCWTGTAQKCTPTKTGWVGGSREGPTPPSPIMPASPTYDDTDWLVVDAPHDSLIDTPYSINASNSQGSIPKNVSWYRKHMVLPAAWQGSHVSVYFEGVFAVTRIFFNGQELTNHTGAGYTSFAARLDNATTVNWGGANVLALFSDSSTKSTTGWWYEGGGIFSDCFLRRTSNPLRLADDGVFTPAEITGPITQGPTPSAGLMADAQISPRVTVEMAASSSSSSSNSLAAPADFSVTFDVFAGPTLVAHSPPFSGTAQSGSFVTLTPPPFSLPGASLWSIARPFLYTVVASLLDGSGGVIDSVNVSMGVRRVSFDANEGSFINNLPVKLRGFCDHASFASVGMAVPPRINFFRMQQMRGMGANSWRMSHNPGRPSTFALGDVLGMTFLDENRVMKNGSFTDGVSYVEEVGNMVRRDRQHPSILFYSFCNEAGCLPTISPALPFKEITLSLDDSRNVTMNYFLKPIQQYPTGSVTVVDVQGLSHPGLADAQTLHASYPNKPIGATECCSCQNQREEDSDLTLPGNTTVAYRSNSGPCQVGQTNVSDGNAWMFGQYVWTAHDYYGEPHGWPHVNSAYGQIDLSGFLKAPSFWFRSKWLANVAAMDEGRPPISSPTASAVVRIVETWAPPTKPGMNRTINVYASSPALELSVNGGAPLGAPSKSAGGVYTWSVPYSPGAITAKLMGGNGGSGGASVLAQHTRTSWGAPASIALSLDVPSLATGTGTALYLDGGDVALVRATVLDSVGAVVMDSTINVTFWVTGGPGVVLGCGNGDPANRDPNGAPWKPAYHGLVRAIIRANLDATTPDALRALRAMIDVDAGKGPKASGILPVGGTPPQSITLAASAPGLPTATLTIPLSIDPKDSVLGAASSSLNAADVTVA